MPSHQGQRYHVEDLDFDKRKAYVKPVNVDYFMAVQPLRASERNIWFVVCAWVDGDAPLDV